MHDTRRTANLLGATGLAVADLALAGITDAAKVSASGGAALVVLSTAPGLSVTELGRRVGLSQPAAARMVDALESDQLLDRRPSAGRSVQVRLTRSGRRAAHRLLTARDSTLTEVVGALDEDEQATLAGLLDKLLTRLYEEVGNADLVCRLCDRVACTNLATCPVGHAEREAQVRQGP